MKYTLHLSMVSRPRLVPNHRPLLELWPIHLQEKGKTKITWRGTVPCAGPKKHGAIGRIVVRQHLYRAAGRGSLGTSKVKHRLNLGIDHAHHCLNVLAPFLYGRPALRTMDLGGDWVMASFVRTFVALISWKWCRVVPLIRGIQLKFKSLYCPPSFIYTSQNLCDFIHLT